MSRIRLRRNYPDIRFEIMPMLDVLLFLLTFFMYSIAFMVRVDLVPMELRKFHGSTPARPAAAATVSVDLDGKLFLDLEPIELPQLSARLLEYKAAEPDLVVYLALAHGEGRVDRAPILQDAWDALSTTGLKVSVVGRPKTTPKSTMEQIPVEHAEDLLQPTP
ncbi:MAG: biopolymer transporter ExbD [Phycisphaerales bacterium]|nr:biopolymer transporter ExbD [Phycisphaerales bacterium]